MPAEVAIPRLVGIDMYGSSIPASQVGGDLVEYINFQQRYDIDARIARALRLSKEYLEPIPDGQLPRNSWIRTWSGCSLSQVLMPKTDRNTGRPRDRSNCESLRICRHSIDRRSALG